MRRVVLGLVVAVVGIVASAIPSAASAFDCHHHSRHHASRPAVPNYGYYRPAPRGYYAPPAAYAPPPVSYYPPAVPTQPYRGVFIGGPNVSLGLRF